MIYVYHVYASCELPDGRKINYDGVSAKSAPISDYRSYNNLKVELAKGISARTNVAVGPMNIVIRNLTPLHMLEDVVVDFATCSGEEKPQS